MTEEGNLFWLEPTKVAASKTDEPKQKKRRRPVQKKNAADDHEANYKRDVKWAYDHLDEYTQAVQRKDKTEKNRIESSAPSPGARSLIRYGENSFAAFMKDIVNKTLTAKKDVGQKMFEDDEREQFRIVRDAMINVACPHCNCKKEPICPNCGKHYSL